MTRSFEFLRATSVAGVVGILCLLSITTSARDEETKEESSKTEKPPTVALVDSKKESEKKTSNKETITIDGSESKKERLKGPDIVLVESKQESIQEYRQNGRLTMIKIVPKNGKPYYLVPEDPTKHFGDLERADRLLPRWKIKEF